MGNLKLDELEVGFCDEANQDVPSLDNISVEPFPLVIATGADITLNVQITLNEPVPAGATVSLRSTVRVSFPSQFLACPLVTSALAPALMMEMSSLLAPVTSFAPPMSLKVKSVLFLSTLAHTVVLTLSHLLFQRSLESLWTFLPLELIMPMPL